MAAAGPGLCERDRAVLGQFLCMGWVKSNCFRYLASRSCVPAEDLEKYAGGKIPVWLDRGRGGGIRNAQPAGGVRADPPAHVVAVHRDPGR